MEFLRCALLRSVLVSPWFSHHKNKVLRRIHLPLVRMWIEDVLYGALANGVNVRVQMAFVAAYVTGLVCHS